MFVEHATTNKFGETIEALPKENGGFEMTDEEKIERIVSDLERDELEGETDTERIILDMKYLINLSKGLLNSIEELRVNHRTSRERNRYLRRQNEHYYKTLKKIAETPLEGEGNSDTDMTTNELIGMANRTLEGEKAKNELCEKTIFRKQNG